MHRLTVVIAVWAALVTGAAGVAVLTEDEPASTTAAAHGTHEPAAQNNMWAVQRAVREAYCPAPGSEMDVTEGPAATASLRISADRYGDGPLRIAGGVVVRVDVVNDDDRDHDVEVFHESRPGCPLASVTVIAGGEAALDLRLAPGTYVYGDRSHRAERDLLVVE